MNLRRLTLFVAATLILNGTVAWAGDLEDGAAAIERQDYVTARKLVTPLAQRGNAGAQRILGFMYMYDLGVGQNYVKARMWWSQAAANGDAKAAEYRDVVSKALTAEQIKESQKMEADCKQRKFKGCD